MTPSSTATPAESDPFFQLLTDALRAGPGSPQWGEAVAKLRDGGVEGADEYRLIIRAREDIELGREFRKVSAGPGFTRKVLEAVEHEGGRKRNGVPTATLVAILAGVVILGVVIATIVIMSRGNGGNDANEIAVRKLEAVSLPVSVASGSIPGPKNGFTLYQDVMPTTSSTQSAPRALTRLIAPAALDAGVPAMIEAEIVVPENAGPYAISVFVSDTADPPDKGVSWLYGEGRASVMAAGKSQESVSIGAPGQPLKVSIRFDQDVAIVEADGRRLYAGPHGLGDKPRYVGMRILQPSDAGKDDVVRVKSISVAQAASSSSSSGGQ